MKIVAVYLSARKEGASSRALDALTQGAEEAGATVKRYRVGAKIRGCQGCRCCKNNHSDCVVQDGLEGYWADVTDADVLLLGAGNYMGDVQAQAIAFMNRHYCMSEGSPQDRSCRMPAGKQLLGVFAQGAPDTEQYLEPYRKYLRHFTDWGMAAEEPLVVSERALTEDALAALRAKGKALAEG